MHNPDEILAKNDFILIKNITEYKVHIWRCLPFMFSIEKVP